MKKQPDRMFGRISQNFSLSRKKLVSFKRYGILFSKKKLEKIQNYNFELV